MHQIEAFFYLIGEFSGLGMCFCGSTNGTSTTVAATGVPDLAERFQTEGGIVDLRVH